MSLSMGRNEHILEVLRLAETKKWVILNFRAKWENDPNAENLEGTEKYMNQNLWNDTWLVGDNGH